MVPARRLVLLLSLLASGALARQAVTLDSKLSQQWERFEKARAEGLRGNAVVTRERWEKILQVSPSFTSSDKKELRARQDRVAEAARLRHQDSSALDLRKLRQLPANETQKFCAAFPKGGMLHVHSFGTMSEAAVFQILEKGNPILHAKGLHGEFGNPAGSSILYPDELAFLLRLHSSYGEGARYLDLNKADRGQLIALFFLGSGSHPFARFESIFSLTRYWMQSDPAQDPRPIMYEDFFKRAMLQRVSYVEFSEIGEAGPAWLAPLDGWAADAKARFGITARMLYAFIRAFPPEALAKSAGALLALPPSKSFVGINLVANETSTPMLERGQTAYRPVEKARAEKRSGLRLTTHAGELGDARNVRDALLLGAERIGHGSNLREDPVTLEYARLHSIPLEANLTSNVRLRAVKSIAEHPFLYFLRLGLKVSLSTDDEGILETDMNRECEAAVRETDMSYAELREMASNSLSTAFAGAEVVAPLQAKLETDLQRFEKDWKAALAK